MKYIKEYYQIILSIIIFSIILIYHIPFYKAIILMLEFIVIIEVVKMIGDFIENKKIRLRFAIDIFIIFLIRDVIILSTDKTKDYFDILFLICVIFSFFIFRIMAVKYSPSLHTKKSLKTNT